METLNLQISQLHPSKINPRKDKGSKQSIEELTASIKKIGIIQPPTVRKNGSGYDVLWGNRRVVAAKKAGLERVECIVVDIDDQEARIAATAENVVRLAMDPMDQFEAFQKIFEDDETPHSIAIMFGVSEHLVNQRLRLAELDPMVKSAYRKGTIDIDACMAMTLGNKKEQRTLLKDNTTSEFMIKRHLVSGKVAMKEAMFDPKLYTGSRVVDLFDTDDDEAGYAIDKEEFYKLQFDHLEALADIDSKVWLFAVITESSPYDIKVLDGVKIEKHYVNEHDMSMKEKKKYGIIYHIDPNTLRVQISHGWQYCEDKKKLAKSDNKDGKEDVGLTQGQNANLAVAMIAMWQKEADLTTALAFYLSKRYHQKVADLLRMGYEDLVKAFILDVSSYASKTFPDSLIEKQQKKGKWSLRKTWTPDEAFLKPYNQATLEKIAKDCNISLAGSPKKGQKVDVLTKAFNKGEGKTKEWLP